MFVHHGSIVTHGSNTTRVFRVKHMKRVKAIIEDEAGKTYEARIEHLKVTTLPFVSTAPAAKAEVFHLGDAVAIEGHNEYGALVVIKLGTQSGCYNLAKLNGGDNMFWRNVDAQKLIRLAADDV